MLSRLVRAPEGVPLDRDAGARFLSAVIALMVFLAVLFTAAALALEGVAEQWRRGLTGTMTVEIPWQGETEDYRSRQLAQREALLTMLRSHPDVAEARVVTDQQVGELLGPWIQSESLLADLPLPILIDVQMLTPGQLALGAVDVAVKQTAPGTRTHDHQRWLQDLEAVTGVMRLIAWGVMVIAATAAVLAVASATVSGLAVHRGVIDILHLIGAHDGFIATQFQRHMLRVALPGAVYGFVAALGLILVLGWAFGAVLRPPTLTPGGTGAGGADVSLLPELRLSLWGYLILCVVPLGAVAITVVTARLMVLMRLARLR